MSTAPKEFRRGVKEAGAAEAAEAEADGTAEDGGHSADEEDEDPCVVLV